MKRTICFILGTLIAIAFCIFVPMITTYKLPIILNMILVFLIIYRNGWSIISIVVICSNVIVLPILVQYYMGQSYGLLQLNLVPIHVGQILSFLFLYNISMFMGSIIFKITENEKYTIKLLHGSIVSSQASILFNNVIAIVFTLVAFPRFSLGTTVNDAVRFDMLLPGHSWNQLAIVALIFNMPFLKINSVRATYIFCASWFLLNGERADITGLILGIVIYHLIINDKSGWKKKLPLVVTGLLVGYLLLKVGNMRIGSGSNGKPWWWNVLTFSTASDVGYLLNATFDLIDHGFYTNGLTLLSNIFQILPFSTTTTDFPSVISQYYANPGGEPIISAGVLDFGLWGPIISAAIDLIIIRICLIFKTKFFAFEYLILLCSVPRIAWYGRNFVFSAVFFFIPFVYICNMLLNYNRRENSQFIDNRDSSFDEKVNDD